MTCPSPLRPTPKKRKNTLSARIICVYQKKAVSLRAELLGSFLLSRESDRQNTNPPAPERDQAEGRSQPLLGGYGQGRYFAG